MLNRLKKVFFKDKEIGNANEFTNQYLVDKVAKAFKDVLERDSIEMQMLYDCDFLILLPPEIYSRVELQAPLIAKGMIHRFYEIIKAEKSKYKSYLPLAEAWHIQFIPKDFTDTVAGTDFGTQMDIVSSPVSIKDWNELTEDEVNKVSVNGKHSKYTKWNINEAVLGRVDMLEKGRIRLKFNPNLEVEPQKEAQKTLPVANGTLAKLLFSEGNKYLSFTMKKAELTVSRAKNDQEVSTESRLIIRTTDHGLKPDHFCIRYNPEARSFSIALYAPARINEKSVALSPVKGKEVWHPLTKESAILCGLTQIDFKALK